MPHEPVDNNPELSHTAIVKLDDNGPKEVFPKQVRLQFWDDGSVTWEHLSE